MSLDIVALEDNHLEDAAALVCARYTALRQEVPSLPSRYEDMGTILRMLRGFGGQAPGVAAIRGGQLVGFLLGTLIATFRGERSVISPEWANGAELGDSRRIYEEMYASLSARWVANGCFTHLVGMLAHDREGMEGWHWLGFGMIAADAVRDLSPLQGPVADADIRRGGLGDVEAVIAMGEAIDRHLAAAPTFLPYFEKADRASHEEWLADPKNAAWLGYRGTAVMGLLKQGPASPDACDIIRDERTTSIVGAFVAESARGQGVAGALLNRGLEWARSEGYERCAVDFEPMNVVAARFWMRHFRPVAYALVRHVNERVAWAHAKREDTDMW